MQALCPRGGQSHPQWHHAFCAELPSTAARAEVRRGRLGFVRVPLVSPVRQRTEQEPHPPLSRDSSAQSPTQGCDGAWATSSSRNARDAVLTSAGDVREAGAGQRSAWILPRAGGVPWPVLRCAGEQGAPRGTAPPAASPWARGAGHREPRHPMTGAFFSFPRTRRTFTS